MISGYLLLITIDEYLYPAYKDLALLLAWNYILSSHTMHRRFDDTARKEKRVFDERRAISYGHELLSNSKLQLMQRQ